MTYSPFMSCRQAAWLITARLDRELGPLERAALAIHLRICDACPRVVAQLDLLRAATRGLRDGMEQQGVQPES
jgi:anti-sigma factor RsiW